MKKVEEAKVLAGEGDKRLEGKIRKLTTGGGRWRWLGEFIAASPKTNKQTNKGNH